MEKHGQGSTLIVSKMMRMGKKKRHIRQADIPEWMQLDKLGAQVDIKSASDKPYSTSWVVAEYFKD